MLHSTCCSSSSRGEMWVPVVIAEKKNVKSTDWLRALALLLLLLLRRRPCPSSRFLSRLLIPLTLVCEWASQSSTHSLILAGDSKTDSPACPLTNEWLSIEVRYYDRSWCCLQYWVTLYFLLIRLQAAIRTKQDIFLSNYLLSILLSIESPLTR